MVSWFVKGNFNHKFHFELLFYLFNFEIQSNDALLLFNYVMDFGWNGQTMVEIAVFCTVLQIGGFDPF